MHEVDVVLLGWGSFNAEENILPLCRNVADFDGSQKWEILYVQDLV